MQVRLPDGSKITAIKEQKLPFPTVPSAATTVHILPTLEPDLLSVGKFANVGYTTVIHPYQKGVTLHREGTITIHQRTPPELQGCRSASGLWEMSLQQQLHTHPNNKTEQLNSVYDLPSTEMKIRYLHGAAGFPVKDTWIAAIKAGNYDTWPGLSAKEVERYFPESDKTAKGHMNRQRQNVRSTKVVANHTHRNAPIPMPKHNAKK